MFEIPVEAFEYTDEFEMGQLAGLELEEEARRRPYRRGGYLSRPRRYTRPRPLRPLRPPRPPRWPRPRPRLPVRIVEPAPYPISEPSPPQGSEYVRWVQSALNQILGLRLPLDGIMGPRIRDAIRDFQRRRGLPADGIVGPDTERALLAARRGQAPSRGNGQRAELEMLEASNGLGELEQEDKGRRPDYVRWVQSSLNRILGLRLAVDGVMGPKTRSAIRDFQRRSGLAVDGVVGTRTEGAIKAALGGQKPSKPPSPSTVGPSPMAPTRPPQAPLCDREGRRLLGSGLWTGGTTVSVRGGQGMNFLLKNLNVLGTTVRITDQTGQSQARIIPPLSTTSMSFARFGCEPMPWTFRVDTNSDVFLVEWKLCSTWVPGDPRNC